MLDSEWECWAEKHAATFALDGEGNVGMFAAWREVFEARGYSAGELNEATVWIGAFALGPLFFIYQCLIQRIMKDNSQRMTLAASHFAGIIVCRYDGSRETRRLGIRRIQNEV